MRSRWASERGLATVEVVLWVPALLLVVALMAYGARVEIGKQKVQSAAEEAARTASISRSEAQALSDANTVALRALAEHEVTCVNQSIQVDTSAFAAPVGTPGDVRVTITCDVDMGMVWVPGAPPSFHAEATALSPLDTYRER